MKKTYAFTHQLSCNYYYFGGFVHTLGRWISLNWEWTCHHMLFFYQYQLLVEGQFDPGRTLRLSISESEIASKEYRYFVTARIRRMGKVIFSVCPHLPGGGRVPHLRSEWGGYPISGLGRGGTPSQVWVGGTPSQVWVVGVPHPRSR